MARRKVEGHARPSLARLFEQALERHRAADVEEAERLYRAILARDPRQANAWYLRSVIAMERRDHVAAAALLQRAVGLAPDNAIFLTNLGEAERRLGNLDDAEAALRRALANNPQLAAAHFNLGLVCDDRGELETAIVAYTGALECSSTLAPAALRLLARLRQNAEHERAIALYSKQRASLTDTADLRIAMGEVYADLFRVDEARAHFERALELEPNSAAARLGLAGALIEQGQPRQAVAMLERAVELEPERWQAHSALVYQLAFDPQVDAQGILAEARRFDARHAAPLERRIPHANGRDPSRRLRVGYVSPDFREHPVSNFLPALLRAHDRRELSAHCYSSVRRKDSVTELVRSYADEFHEVATLADDALAHRIESDGIDILVDLAMHTNGTRLLTFARRPAPVQLCWLAYPGTTGLSALDYRLSDVHLDPPGEGDELYSERSWRLPETFWCYAPLATPPPPGALPAASTEFVTFGSLNGFRRLNPAALALFARVLHAIPESRLLMIAPEGETRRRTLEPFLAQGIDPARIEFTAHCPRAQYLELYGRIDCCLDPIPNSGGTTSLDALYMGVPVITLRGASVAGRSGVTFLRNLALDDLIAADADEYVAKARALGRDRGRLAELRRGLRARMEASPLMAVPRFTRHLESAYRALWREWCSATS